MGTRLVTHNCRACGPRERHDHRALRQGGSRGSHRAKAGGRNTRKCRGKGRSVRLAK